MGPFLTLEKCHFWGLQFLATKTEFIIYFLSQGVCFPFTAFKVDTLNYLMMAPSQLHPTSLTYVKAYQHFYEYLKGKTSTIVFFHLFRCVRGISVCPRGKGFDLLVPTINFLNLFLNHPLLWTGSFLTSVHSEAHAIACAIERGERYM